MLARYFTVYALRHSQHWYESPSAVLLLRVKSSVDFTALHLLHVLTAVPSISGCHEGSRWRPSLGSLAQPTTLVSSGSTADRHEPVEDWGSTRGHVH